MKTGYRSQATEGHAKFHGDLLSSDVYILINKGTNMLQLQQLFNNHKISVQKQLCKFINIMMKVLKTSG